MTIVNVAEERLAEGSERAAALLHRLAAFEAELAAAGDESEDLGRLSPRAAEILIEIGATRMRLPVADGGLGLGREAEMRILTRLAEIDAASAWTTMVTNTSTSMLAQTAGDDFHRELFSGDRPPIAAGVAAPGGLARRVEGGFIIDGTWRFCSGIHLAEWVMCNPLLDGDPSQPIAVTVRVEDTRIHDSWNALGLAGSGSDDFSLDAVFVSDAHVRTMRPRRTDGTPPSSQPDEHIAVALGLATRALRELRAGYDAGHYKWRDREVVQSEFSRLTVTLDATQRMAFALFAEVDRCEAEALARADVLRLRALATYATELAVACAGFAMRRGGGRALYKPNALERTLRDAITAQAHIHVSDQNYADHGASVLGLATESGVHP